MFKAHKNICCDFIVITIIIQTILIFKIMSVEIQKTNVSLFSDQTDETLSIKNLRDIMKAASIRLEDEELRKMIKEVQQTPNGRIDFPKLLHLLSIKIKSNDFDDEIKDAFRIYEKVNNGTISAIELRYVMKTVWSKINEKNIEKMIELEKDDRGYINYWDFIQKLQAKWKNQLIL
ncbi:calmodulin-2/4-like [Centruroides sculpturatus]|uniref:calmodulin-2/4-like n=1 Tax=Centruroides sculpturatus TaxID=218467 RepID=UPI000C6DFF11|nr:calmodulin-2/4-like [Centruroides sculpturatus]